MDEVLPWLGLFVLITIVLGFIAELTMPAISPAQMSAAKPPCCQCVCPDR